MDLLTWRRSVQSFIADAVVSGETCREFGAIMPPGAFDSAQRWQRHCHRHGFAGIDWPSEHGGRGLTAEHNAIWFEECARNQVAPYMNFQGFVLAAGAIRAFGTEQQKTRFLEPTLSGDMVWCQLFSEPGSGSDLVSLRSRAERTGTGWAITGQKVWSSTAQLAQQAILLARTGDDPGHRGISFFLIDMDQPGIEVRPIKQMTGDSEFCEVFMTDAIVPEDHLVGELNAGWTVATSVLADERAAVGATSVTLRHRLNELASRAAEMSPATRSRALALLSSGAATAELLGRSGNDPRLGPLTKLAMTELTSARATAALDGLGAAGTLESDLAEEFLYTPGMRIAGGTSEIQRNLIGERLLGLPREPRVTGRGASAQ